MPNIQNDIIYLHILYQKTGLEFRHSRPVVTSYFPIGSCCFAVLLFSDLHRFLVTCFGGKELLVILCILATGNLCLCRNTLNCILTNLCKPGGLDHDLL